MNEKQKLKKEIEERVNRKAFADAFWDSDKFYRTYNVMTNTMVSVTTAITMPIDRRTFIPLQEMRKTIAKIETEDV